MSNEAAHTATHRAALGTTHWKPNWATLASTHRPALSATYFTAVGYANQGKCYAHTTSDRCSQWH